MDVKSMPGLLIALFIALAFVVGLLPSMVTSVIGTNTSGWGATEIAIYSILSIVIVAAPVLMIYRATME